MKIEYTNATFEDLGVIMEFVRLLHSELPYKTPEVNWLKVARHMDISLRAGFAILFACEEKPIGCFLGMARETWYSDIPIASPTLTYVLPEYRNSNAGLLGYRLFKKWAQDRNMKLFLAYEGGLNSDKMDKLFTKMGCTKLGSQFMEQ